MSSAQRRITASDLTVVEFGPVFPTAATVLVVGVDNTTSPGMAVVVFPAPSPVCEDWAWVHDFNADRERVASLSQLPLGNASVLRLPVELDLLSYLTINTDGRVATQVVSGLESCCRP